MKQVRISDLAEIATCERRIFLRHKYGESTTAEQEVARARGTKIHTQAETEKRLGSGKDKRCFIATAVYGIDARQTVRLRRLRDDSLMTTQLGRVAVNVYYSISPGFAEWLDRSPAGRRIARKALDVLVRRLGP